jgi:hypothetical protein
MTRKVVVIYANCQGSVLAKLLNENYSDLFIVHMLLNYTYINEQKPLPVDLISTADVFIYQPIDKHDSYNTNEILEKYVSGKATKISFPYIYFLGYHPDHHGSIAPFTAYGHEKLHDLKSRGMDNQTMIKQCLTDPEFLSVDYMTGKIEEGLSILKSKEQDCTIKISDFIRRTYRQKLLFNTVNHPSNELYYVLFDSLCRELGIETKNIQQESEFQKEEIDIIYFCVQNFHQLEFVVPTPVIDDQPKPNYLEWYTEQL